MTAQLCTCSPRCSAGVLQRQRSHPDSFQGADKATWAAGDSSNPPEHCDSRGRAGVTPDKVMRCTHGCSSPSTSMRVEYGTLLTLGTLHSSFLLDPTDSVRVSFPSPQPLLAQHSNHPLTPWLPWGSVLTLPYRTHSTHCTFWLLNY